ncbi:laccase-2-like [Homalodisca vitripennis]|uniref:laccase-2-like n=1 Tax=Homalodisca vitripennis TaxID=197043 RepID=UPI001EEAC412|nr:laccase-2-like [Homalodisca vitripennis]
MKTILFMFILVLIEEGRAQNAVRDAYNKNNPQNRKNGEDQSQYEAFDNYKNRLAYTVVDRGNSQAAAGSNNYENVNDGEVSDSGTAGKLLPFLQVDDIDSGLYDDPDDLPQNSCTRPCVAGQTRTCYYRFALEPYSVMGKACNDCLNNMTQCFARGCVTADGFEKAILTINRRMPAPSIQVCQGDLIVADVKNLMPGRSTVIHWHGLRQINAKFMDGVPMVTQCPITESQIFRYTFRAEEPGLDFYHSHDGLQKVDGIVGSFVIRQPRSEDPNTDEYDFDLPSHVIVIQDWYHLMADAMFPGLRFRDTEQMAASYLIQGKGRYTLSDGTLLANTPIAEFNVERGNRYVFRIVAGTCFECQYIFTIENHDFVIIGADAQSTKPYRVNSLTMSPGERYSVVVNCNKNVGAYWIQVRTVGLCNHMRAQQVAILRYSGATGNPASATPTFDVSRVNNPGLTMSPVNSLCTAQTRRSDGPCIHDLRSARNAPARIRNAQPDMRLVWGFGFYFFTDEELYNSGQYHRFLQSPFDPVGSTVNGVVNMFPPSPILSQFSDVPKNIICPAQGFRADTWNRQHRECVNVMKVPANSVVEIVAIDIANHDPAGISHAIHLHGYDMYVLEMGVMNGNVPFNQSYVQLMNYLNSNNRRSIPVDVVTKDTFPLTSGGYVVVRILTDNPGYWFFHCHFAYHLDSGMSGILQVGEQNTFPSPPAGFPKCGDFLPIP